MRILDILQHKGSFVETITPDRNVHDAIRIMCKRRIGALVVTSEGGEVVGIVTERDILRACGRVLDKIEHSAAPSVADCSTLVEEIMTVDLVIGLAEDKIDYVMKIMTKNRIRHLPVMDNEQLVGIISIGDVVNAHLEETEVENRMLKDYIRGVPS
jgi:CBS domain-containing protein